MTRIGRSLLIQPLDVEVGVARIGGGGLARVGKLVGRLPIAQPALRAEHRRPVRHRAHEGEQLRHGLAAEARQRALHEAVQHLAQDLLLVGLGEQAPAPGPRLLPHPPGDEAEQRAEQLGRLRSVTVRQDAPQVQVQRGHDQNPFEMPTGGSVGTVVGEGRSGEGGGGGVRGAGAPSRTHVTWPPVARASRSQARS